jgi:hypothetical protein
MRELIFRVLLLGFPAIKVSLILAEKKHRSFFRRFQTTVATAISHRPVELARLISSYKRRANIEPIGLLQILVEPFEPNMVCAESRTGGAFGQMS